MSAHTKNILHAAIRAAAFLAAVAAIFFAAPRAARADGFDDADTTLDQELLEDGRLDITVAFGFQQQHPSEGLLPGISNAATLVDSFKFNKQDTDQNIADLDQQLMEKSLGFKKTVVQPGDLVYQSTIKRGDRTYPVRVHVIYPTGRDSADRLKAQFLADTRTSDVVIYNGHSRHGGGFPDFDRPVLGNGKVFDENPFTGHWSGLDQHPFNRLKKQVFVVNSCMSKQYYQGVLRNKIDGKDPANLALILTQAPGYVEDLAPTNAALIRGLMRGDEPSRIMQSMNQAADAYYDGKYDPKTPPLFVDDGFVTSWVPAPGWHLPAVEADSRDPKQAPEKETAATPRAAAVSDQTNRSSRSSRRPEPAWSPGTGRGSSSDSGLRSSSDSACRTRQRSRGSRRAARS